MTSWWCEQVWLTGGVSTGVVIEVGEGRIRTLHPGVPAPPPGARALPGLTLPGLANAHSHAFHRALRGRCQDGSGTFWDWRRQMYAVAAALTPQRYLALARACFVEMTLAGITTVGEFHYVHHQPGGEPYAEPNAMGLALVEAAEQAGIRLTLLDSCYLTGGVDRGLDVEQRRFGDGSAAAWQARLDRFAGAVRGSAGLQLGAAVHSLRAVPPAEAAVVARWARRHATPLHLHLSEQRQENDDCRRRWGATPTALAHRAGVLTARTTAVHATHLEGDDLELLAASGSHVCLCPSTERDLGDGAGPAAALAGRGVPLCLGSDSQAVIDLFEEARAVELDERLLGHRRGWFRPAALLDAATQVGHAALGWPDAGRLAPGSVADFVTVRLDSVRTAGCPPTAATAVFAASASDVTHVVIAGEAVVRDGRHLRRPDPAGDLTAAVGDVNR